MRIAILVLAGLFAHVASASAQETPMPRGLEKVLVRALIGVEIEGEVVALGPASISLFTAAGVQTVPLESVQRIERRGDRLRNGALIGAAIVGAWSSLALRHGPEFALLIPYGAASGAAIGAAIDALIPGRTTIYSRQPAASMQPAGNRAGMSVKFGF